MIFTDPTLNEVWAIRMDKWTWVKDSATLLIAIISVFFVLKSYGINARTRQSAEQTSRAKFLYDLHKSFFEEAKYDKVREAVDCSSDLELKAFCSKYLEPESPELTRYLNFFHFVAYLQSEGNVSFEDVRALLGYYLKSIKSNPELYAYVRNPHKGYSELSRLLAMID